MRVRGLPYRSIFRDPGTGVVHIVDQTALPHEFRILPIHDVQGMASAIRNMQLRGAPLIGAAGAYGMALGIGADPSPGGLAHARDLFLATRPTAVNLRWAVDRVADGVRSLPDRERAEAAWAIADVIADEDVLRNRSIGAHGVTLIRDAARRHPDRPVEILTHCNAGWLATVDWGTATAPIYLAHDEGIAVHVWVDETRPRNQGASLTAWELGEHGVPHTVVTDNAGGHLMQNGRVDLCLVGTDRTTATGDVANKIGTYLKALAAWDNGVPFYVAAPSSSIDWQMEWGRDIPIEERAEDEVAYVSGRADNGHVTRVRILPEGSRAANPAFDVTPARLVTGLITERGIAPASRAGLAGLFPEHSNPENAW